MAFGAEFYVLLGFLVFVGVALYFGAHNMVLSGLDARGKAIADELAQAVKLREEATALLASFEKKKADAEAAAAQIVAEARAEAERLAAEAADRMKDFVARRTQQAEAKISFAEQQAAADVRAAAADRAVKASEIVLKGAIPGQTGDDLVHHEIDDLRNRLN
jgi:F-type H+-transporting ATPase subunit b